jgi:AraC-like DNA-binding protein
LNERDSVRVKLEPPRGILNVRRVEAAAGLTRYWPSADLAPFVEHYWIVGWDLEQPQVAETVPHPSVHLVCETSTAEAEVVGIKRSRFSVVLEGRGRVVGTKFRPGAFRPFVTRPVSAFTDRRLPVVEVFGRCASRLREQALGHADDLRAIAVVESFLRGLDPAPDEGMLLAGRVAARIAEAREVTRVDRLASEFHTSVRRLQRLFAEYVGVSPRWVIRRYRLLDAVERVGRATAIDWADLALALGYADQAHFIRDFKRLVGRSPADYARRLGDELGSA